VPTVAAWTAWTAWTVWTLAVAALVQHLPRRWFRVLPSVILDRRRVERCYAALGVRHWKRWLPDGGAVVPGASRSRRLGGRHLGALEEFAVACRRGELAHWLSLGPAPALAWWLGGGPGVALVLVAVAVNVPCLVALSYNRHRIALVLARHRPGATLREWNARAPSPASATPPSSG